MTIQTLVNQLILINSKIQNFEGHLGFRKQAVYCRDKDQNLIQFTPHEQIHHAISIILEVFLKSDKQAHSLEGFIQTLSLFWIGFISIHPFQDANGRTAKEFIQSYSLSKNYEILSFDLLDRVLLTGDLKKDFPKVETAFLLRTQCYKNQTGEAI